MMRVFKNALGNKPYKNQRNKATLWCFFSVNREDIHYGKADRTRYFELEWAGRRLYE